MTYPERKRAYFQETDAPSKAFRVWKASGLLLVLIALCLMLTGGAKAEVYEKCSGYISQFRLINAPVKPGEDANFKLAIKYRGDITVTLKNEKTGAETLLKNENCPGAKNMLITVPGSMVEEGVQFSLKASLVYKNREVGAAQAGFACEKPVARLYDLGVTPQFSPVEGEALAIHFSIEQAAKVYAYINKPSGMWIQTLAEGASFQAGKNTLVWNGYSAYGNLADEDAYVVSIYCENEAGQSAILQAQTRLVGIPDGAIIGERSKNITSAILPEGVYEGENAVLKLRTTTAGPILLKLKDAMTGVSQNITGNAIAGINSLALKGDAFLAGHSYVLQVSLNTDGQLAGSAQLSFTAGARQPVAESLSAAGEYKAGYGAYMEIGYKMKTSGYTSLYLIDHAGRKVATVEYGVYRAPGEAIAYWNGVGDDGALLPSGSYTLAFGYWNAAGVSNILTQPLVYTAKEGLPAAEANGSLYRFMLLSDPEQAERTPVKVRVISKRAGNLRIALQRIDGGGTVNVLNKSIPVGTTDITLDGAYFYSYAYTLDASLYESGKRTGRAFVSLHPQIIPPEIPYMDCDDTFVGDWGETCKVSLATKSNGYLYANVREISSDTVLRTIYNGRNASAGEKTFSWDGKTDGGVYAPAGTYVISAQYRDDYGIVSNVAVATTVLEKKEYPAGIYGYVNVGVGTYKTKIFIYSEPGGGTRLGYAYAQSSIFDILAEEGEYLYVECSRMVDEPIRGYVLASQVKRVAITSPYRFDVCISRSGPKAQTIFLYKDNALIDTFRISTGTKVGSTPTGDYLIMNRIPYFYSGTALCYDALRVVGGVCIHRVPLVDGSYRSTTARLGSVASHGCIRVPVEKSEWLYKNIPDTTPVTIFYD